MSPNVGNFVHDLVEMAKAMETLPQVQHDLAEAKGTIENLQQAVQDRELRAIDYKRQIEELQSKVRATEAERDDAELRFLELDEKAHKALGMLDMVQAYAKDARLVIDPPKPAPQPEPAQEVQGQHTDPMGENNPNSPYYNPQVQSEALPTSIGNVNSGEGKLEQTSVTSSANEDATSASQGQGEVNPPSVALTDNQSQSAGSAMENVSGTSLGSEPKPSGPYTGKRYYDHPTYIPMFDWLEGGGTQEDYNWRPSVGAST